MLADGSLQGAARSCSGTNPAISAPSTAPVPSAPFRLRGTEASAALPENHSDVGQLRSAARKAGTRERCSTPRAFATVTSFSESYTTAGATRQIAAPALAASAEGQPWLTPERISCIQDVRPHPQRRIRRGLRPQRAGKPRCWWKSTGSGVAESPERGNRSSHGSAGLGPRPLPLPGSSCRCPAGRPQCPAPGGPNRAMLRRGVGAEDRSAGGARGSARTAGRGDAAGGRPPPAAATAPGALTFRRIAVVSQETAVDLAGLNVLLH